MPDFQTAAGIAGILAAIAALGYAIAFVVLRNRLWASIALIAGSLLSIVVYLGLDNRLAASANPSWLLLALLFGLVGAYGTATHGAYDLALAVRNQPAASGDTPSESDPRGFSAFGLTGIAIILFGQAMVSGATLPTLLGLLGSLSGVLLIAIWLGRLIVLDPARAAIRYPVILQGLIVGPLWLLGVGVSLLNR